MEASTSASEGSVARATSVAMRLTGEGAAALATVCLVGPLVGGFIATHFRGGRPHNGMSHGTLLDSEQVLDDPVVYQMISAGVVRQADIHLHGGRWIVQRVLELVAAFGFEVRSPQLPLPRQVVEARSEIEAEILQWLPLGKTREAAASLLGQEGLWRGLAATTTEDALQGIAAPRGLERLLTPPRVAVVGVPNAGKSTLINALLARERMIGADIAGTTRDWVEEEANLDGLPVILIDTPGFRDAASHASPGAIEQAAVRLAKPIAQQADLLLLLLDMTQPLEAQRPLMREFPQAMLVAGKSDLQTRERRELPEVLRISTRTGEGVAELRLAIRQFFGCPHLPLVRAAVWTPRQRQILAGGGSVQERIAAVVGDTGSESGE